jgi:hypothetical protein
VAWQPSLMASSLVRAEGAGVGGRQRRLCRGPHGHGRCAAFGGVTRQRQRQHGGGKASDDGLLCVGTRDDHGARSCGLRRGQDLAGQYLAAESRCVAVQSCVPRNPPEQLAVHLQLQRHVLLLQRRLLQQQLGCLLLLLLGLALGADLARKRGLGLGPRGAAAAVLAAAAAAAAGAAAETAAETADCAGHLQRKCTMVIIGQPPNPLPPSCCHTQHAPRVRCEPSSQPSPSFPPHPSPLPLPPSSTPLSLPLPPP